MPTNHLYHTWIQRIIELRPGQVFVPESVVENYEFEKRRFIPRW